MLQSPSTVSIAFVNGMLSGVIARGSDPNPFLDDAGIAQELLGHPGARVTTTQYVALFGSIIDRTGDEGLGFFSRRLKRGSFGLIARSAIGAHDLEIAIHRLSRTFNLLQDDVELELAIANRVAGLAIHHTNSWAPPMFMHELLVRVFWRLLAWLAGGHFAALRFGFAFPQPWHVGSYDKVFPAPLIFDQPHSVVWFDASHLRMPVSRSHSALQAFLANSPGNLIVPRRGTDIFGSRVRSYLHSALPEWPDLRATAEALHISVSTLQRHLTSEQTSFQSLKDELRRDLAIVRLADDNTSLVALACELGFADSAAFQRAFKSWTGSAPGAYRRGERGA